MTTQEMVPASSEVRLEGWQIARPILYKTLEVSGGTSRPFASLNRLVGGMTGVPVEDVHRARVVGSSSLVEELLVDSDFDIRLNMDTQGVRDVLAAPAFATASGIILPSGALRDFVVTQLAIDAGQEFLDARMHLMHQGVPLEEL